MKMADKLDDMNKRLLVVEQRLDQYLSDSQTLAGAVLELNNIVERLSKETIKVRYSKRKGGEHVSNRKRGD